jgi:hypothetical protein
VTSGPVIIGSEGREAQRRTLCLTPDGHPGAAAGQVGCAYNVMTSHGDGVGVYPRVQL